MWGGRAQGWNSLAICSRTVDDAQAGGCLESEQNGEVCTEKLVHIPAIGEEQFESSMLVVISGRLLVNVS